MVYLNPRLFVRTLTSPAISLAKPRNRVCNCRVLYGRVNDTCAVADLLSDPPRLSEATIGSEFEATRAFLGILSPGIRLSLAPPKIHARTGSSRLFAPFCPLAFLVSSHQSGRWLVGGGGDRTHNPQLKPPSQQAHWN